MLKQEYKKAKVLCIDDNVAILKLLEAVLEKEFDVTIIDSGAKALELIDVGEIPDLILLDTVMPDMDGYEVCKRLKADRRFVDIPVIFITSLDDVKSQVKGFEIGAIDYIFKPINYDLLKTRVKAHIALSDKFNKEIMKMNEKLVNLITQLENARQIAEIANETKSRFLSNMSHEMRTPLNGLMGFLQILELTELDEEQIECVETMKISATNLLNVINDILDISKIEAGKLKIENIPFDLYRIIKDALVPFEPVIREKRINCNVNIAIEVPKLVKGDPTRLKQVIINLISNAIKFTNKGEILVEINLESDEQCEQNELKVVFLVKDTGIGISEKDAKDLFEPFVQADCSGTRKYGGTGLGLAITKSLVELMKGKIELESSVGFGSVFKFFILLEKTSNNELIKIQKFEGEQRLNENGEFFNIFTLGTNTNKAKESFELAKEKNKKEKLLCRKFNKKFNVLLVEDNESNRMFFLKLSQIMGINCDTALNGKEAIVAFKNKKYQMIFMDCQMPVIDGYEATRQIRRLEKRGEHTPIVALTANAMKGDAQKCFDVGMDAYLSKPVSLRQIEDVILKYTQNSLEENDYSESSNEYEDLIKWFMSETALSESDAKILFAEGLSELTEVILAIESFIREGDALNICKVVEELADMVKNLRITEIEPYVVKAKEAALDNDFERLSEILVSIRLELGIIL